MTVTELQLSKIFPAAAGDFLDQVADELNRDPSSYGLDTAQRLAHFFAQVRQECGPALQAMVESLVYSPDRLVAVFGYYKERPDEAQQDGYLKDASGAISRPAAQETIANKVYALRNGNGDEDSGDGWRFRGRGFIQVTGRDNYSKVNDTCQTLYADLHLDFISNPDSMGSFPGALRSAIGFWVSHGLSTVADRGTSDDVVNSVTDVVDRFTNSRSARIANFATALDAFQS